MNRETSTGAPSVVIMGVAGCGKSTLGSLLAARLGTDFVEGDAYHPEANITKMAAGEPLSDADRWPWLHTLASMLATTGGAPGAVVACSALRRSYRDVLRGGCRDLRFVHLDLPYNEVVRRLAQRRGHFMPASMADSQIAALEPLEDDELGITLDAMIPADDLLEAALQWCMAPPANSPHAGRAAADPSPPGGPLRPVPQDGRRGVHPRAGRDRTA